MIEKISHKKYSMFFLLLIFIEALLLMFVLKSTTLSLVMSMMILAAVFFLIYPEIGFAVALTSNVLVMIFFDSVKSPFPAPHLVVYLAMIIAALFIYSLKHGLDSEMVLGAPIKLSFYLWLLMILGVFVSSNPAYGRHKVVFYFFYNLLLIALPLIFYKDFERLGNIFKIAFLAGLVLALFSSLKALTVPDYIRFSPSESVNPIWLGRSLGVSVLCGVYWFVTSKQSFTKIFLLVTIPFFLFPMFRTWSRAPLVGMLLCVFLFYLLQPDQPLSRKIKISLPFLISSIIILLNTATHLVSRLRTPMIQEMSTAFRLLAWLKGWEYFMASPVTGVGTGGYYMKMLYGDFTYPHNLFLEVACENGIIGLTIMIAFVIIVFKMARKNVRRYRTLSGDLLQLSIAVTVIFIYSLWNAMFSGAIYSNEIVWLSAGFIYVLYLSHKRTEERHRM
jgi:O-antigen ligase